MNLSHRLSFCQGPIDSLSVATTASSFDQNREEALVFCYLSACLQASGIFDRLDQSLRSARYLLDSVSPATQAAVAELQPWSPYVDTGTKFGLLVLRWN